MGGTEDAAVGFNVSTVLLDRKPCRGETGDSGLPDVPLVSLIFGQLSERFRVPSRVSSIQ